MVIAVAVFLLASCALKQDAPRLLYLCDNDLSFEARLYRDMVLIEGQRGHVVLERELESLKEDELKYADNNLKAQFGLGDQGRLVRLDYRNIPQAVYCQRLQRAGEDDAGQTPSELSAVQAFDGAGPRPPVPFDPFAPIQTNVQTEFGPVRIMPGSR